MEWLALSLACALSMASADAATKFYLGEYSAKELVVIRFVTAGVLLAPLLWLQSWPPLPAAFWGWVCAMVPLEILAMALYVSAIRSNPLSLTLPYLAFTPVFIIVTGYLLVGEQVTAKGFSGILLVVIGSYVLNLDRARGAKWHAPLGAIVNTRGSRLMLGVAALYSLTSVMAKGALSYVPAGFFAPFYFCFVAFFTALLFGASNPENLRVLWRRPGPQLLVGVLMAIMIVTHLAAVERVEVAYMIAVKRTSLLFGILYGAWLFKEGYLGRHLFAGALMVTGVTLIVL